MIEIKGKNFCENCFEEINETVCPHCGHDSSKNVCDPTLLASGSILFGKYVIGTVIGKGGFGVTYLAFDTAAERKVAIKEYFPYSIARRVAAAPTVTVCSEDSKEAFELGAEKFYEEAKLVSRFNGNPNIVKVYEFFYENDTVYLVMEYLNGQTLKEYIRDKGTLTAPQALHVAKGVANALAAAHKSSVLHRDISPDNIILCADGNVKLIDFGAARQLVAEHSQSFSVILKPGFAPIEQYNKKGNQGPWTDIYSLGATLYFAMTGDIPEDPMARFDDDDTFKENLFNIYLELWNVILKATSLKNEDRYKDADEMLSDLENMQLEPQPVIPVMHTEASSSEPRGADSSDTVPYNYKQHITFSPDSKKKGFFGRHSRALIASAAGLAIITAGVIIAVSASKPPAVSPVASNAGQVITETDGVTTAPEPEKERVYFADEDKTAVLYSALDDSQKELYELIYNCIANDDEALELAPQTYDKETVDAVYQRVLFDNPEFYYGENYGTAENDGYISSINPVYAETDREAMDAEVSEVVRICRKDTDIDTLCSIHDYMIAHTEPLERNSDPLGSSAYGVTINKAADDIGFAKAFCYYAQKAGFPCYVVEGEFKGQPRAWCRFTLNDDLWYNTDVYGDVFASSLVTKMEVTWDGNYFQTFFLTNDEHIQKQGYVLAPEYEYLLTGEYAAASPKENFYFQRNYQYYFRSSPEAVYEFYVPWLVERYQEGQETIFSTYMTPFLADGVYDKMNNELLDDLKENYGIEASELTIEYLPNTLNITLK